MAFCAMDLPVGSSGLTFGHRHEPLVGQHRFDHLTGACATRHHQPVLPGLDQQTQCVEVRDDPSARVETVQAAVGRGRRVVERRVQCQHADHRQRVALAHGIVVHVVGGRDLDHAGAEGRVDVVVGDHRYRAVAQRQLHPLPDQVVVARIVRMHHHRDVAQHGLGAGRGHHQAVLQLAVDRLRSVGERVADMPEVAVFLLAFDLQVADGSLEHRVPVDQPLAAVDQALLVQAHEGFGHDGGQPFVHREVFAAPVHAVAHAAHLRGDGVARLLLPLPHARDEVPACLGRCGAHVVPADALVAQLALDDDLGCDPGVVGARHPDRVLPAHAVVARERIHDGLVEGVPHVQRAGHVGWRQLDRKRCGCRIRLAGAAHAGPPIAVAFPLRTPEGLQRSGFE